MNGSLNIPDHPKKKKYLKRVHHCEAELPMREADSHLEGVGLGLGRGGLCFRLLSTEFSEQIFNRRLRVDDIQRSSVNL